MGLYVAPRPAVIGSFEAKRSGIYTVEIVKTVASGEQYVYSTYHVFSYSKEYDTFVDETLAPPFMQELADKGQGKVIATADAWRIYEGLKKTIHVKLDPTVLFMILSAVFLLLDVAVRKFKFKWLHEIIREKKEKKELESKQ